MCYFSACGFLRCMSDFSYPLVGDFLNQQSPVNDDNKAIATLA